MTTTATVCGMDAKGRSFLDRVRVLNLSRDGALLEDVSCAVGVGDVLALRCEGSTRRYRVIWEISAGEGRQIGLAGVAAATVMTETWLPASGVDNFIHPRLSVRREHARKECEIAVEMRVPDVSTPMWVTACDISEGGCRVQVPHAMNQQSEINIALWLDGERLWVRGQITHSIYGCGTGIRFTTLERTAQQRIASLVTDGKAKVSDRRESGDAQETFCPAFSVTA